VAVEGKLEIKFADDLAGILATTNDNPRRNGRGFK